jgi:hypothetical protein
LTVGKKRLYCAAAFLILTATEVLIAMFVHDSIIRPYIGDVIVVAVIYCFVRMFLPNGIRLLPLYVFAFAAFVEILQYFHYAELLGFSRESVIGIILGGSFDAADLLCYFAGCAAAFAAQELWRRKYNT